MIKETFIIIFLAFSLATYYLNRDFYISSFSESCGYVFNVSRNTAPYYNNNGICPDPSYKLLCENNNRTVLYVNYGRHLVQAIYADANSATLRSISAGVDNNNCYAISHHSLTYNNFTHAFSAKERELSSKKHRYYVGGLVFISCENPLSPDLYTEIVELCSGEGPKRRYSYVLAWDSSVSQVEERCKIDLMVEVSPWGPMTTCNENCSYLQVESEEVKGIHIKWLPNRCGVWEGEKSNCWFENSTNMVLCHIPLGLAHISVLAIVHVMVIVTYWSGAKFVLGAPCALTFLILRWRRRH